MHFARLAAFDHEADLSSRAFADQMMMNRRDGEQCRYRRSILSDAAIRKHDDSVTIIDCLAGIVAKTVERLLHSVPAFAHVEQHLQGDGSESGKAGIAEVL